MKGKDLAVSGVASVMPRQWSATTLPVSWSPRLALGAVICLLLLSGCGTDGFARDALIEDPGANAFLTRVGKQCGQQTISNQPLAYLLDVNSNDTYFVDATTKLYLGQFTRQQYADAIGAFYPASPNQAALNCIFGLLP